MTGAPQIDDRRRFRELWKELVFARVAPGPVQGCAMVGIVYLLLEAAGRFGLACLPVLFIAWAGILAASSAVAKRGRFVFPRVAGGVLLSQVASVAGLFAVEASDEAGLVAVCAATAAAIGAIEGLLERSLATLYCGLLGGALVGALTPLALVQLLWGPSAVRELSFFFLFFACLVPICNVGIGLSLALGRWIRDLPKRKASGPPDGPEGPDAPAAPPA